MISLWQITTVDNWADLPFAKGSSSFLNRAKDAIYKPEMAHLAYKLLLSTKPQLVEGMHLDKVFLTLFHGLGKCPPCIR